MKFTTIPNKCPCCGKGMTRKDWVRGAGYKWSRLDCESCGSMLTFVTSPKGSLDVVASEMATVQATMAPLVERAENWLFSMAQGRMPARIRFVPPTRREAA